HLLCFFFTLPHPPPTSTLFPYTTLFRSPAHPETLGRHGPGACRCRPHDHRTVDGTRLAGQHTPLHPRRHDAEATSRRPAHATGRSEEHTSELQSRGHLVCRLLLEKKKRT